jgi:hypothetical protein
MPSLVTPSAAITRSSKNPAAIALTARWCDCSAMRSWSERAIFHCFAISSQCSPMLLPVARFFTAGTCRPKSFQRNSPRRSMRSPKVRDWLSRAASGEALPGDLHAAHRSRCAARRGAVSSRSIPTA